MIKTEKLLIARMTKFRQILSHAVTVCLKLPQVQILRDICFVIIQLIFASSLLCLFTRSTSLKFMARKLSKRRRFEMISIIFGLGSSRCYFSRKCFRRRGWFRSIESRFKKCGNIQFPFALAVKQHRKI